MWTFLSSRPVRLLLAAAALVVTMGAARKAWKAYRYERKLVFEQHGLGGATPAESGLPGALDVEYGRSSDGAALRGWYAPSGNGAAIVFVHGAGGDRRSLSPEAALLRSAGYGVLLIDLPGTGDSGGRITAGPSEEAAIQAAVEFLARQGATRIGGLSFSIGSAFLARAAAIDPRLRAVVLEATSRSVGDRLRVTQGRWAWLTTVPAALAFFQVGTNPWRHPAAESARAIAPRPLLLIAGSQDRIASPEMAREIVAAAGPTARLEVFDTGHGGFWQADPARYRQLLLDFFRTALAG